MTWMQKASRAAAVIVLGTCLSVGGTVVPAVGAAPHDVAPAKAVSLPTPLARVLARVNAARARHDRKPLALNTCLTTKVAQPWAVHLADIQRLEHRNLGTVFAKCPGFHTLGENIASGYPTAAAVMRGWMHSPGHRRNILSRKFTRIGLGLAYTDNGTPYWVQNFAG